MANSLFEGEMTMIGFLIGLLGGGALGYISYFVSQNLYIGLAVGISFFAAIEFLIIPWSKQYSRRHKVRRECYQFINSFIVATSVTESIDASYQAAITGASGEYKSLLDSLVAMPIRERVEYLASYFDSSLYKMFLSVYKLYEERGGDILDLSSELLEEATRVEEAGEEEKKNSSYSLLQYGLLWLISLGIVVFLRFGLANFYDQLINSMLFIVSIGVYFAFLLGSLIFYGLRYCEPKFSHSLNKKGGEAK